MRSTLDPTLDVVFKMLFAAPESRGTLISLLTAVLRPSAPIVEIQIRNPEIRRADVDDKGIKLDMVVALADGTWLDVEMQADKRPAFRNRALYYWARLFSSRLGSGHLYAELRPVISVLFLDYRELDGARLHSTFRLLEVHDHSALTDALEIHVVELPKRSTELAAARQEDSELLAWSRFLGATTDEEVEEACMSNPEITKANETLSRLSEAPENFFLALRRELALTEVASNIEGAREEGRGEGRAEMLLDQVRTKFGEPDDHTTARIFKASDRQIRGWARAILTARTIEELFADPQQKTAPDAR